MKKFLLSCAMLCMTLMLGTHQVQAKVTIKLSSQYATEHTTTKLMYEFKDIVEKETNGSVKVRVFPANQLGDYTQVYEEIRRGTIDMAVLTIPSQFDNRLEVIYLHYLATNYDEARKIYSPGSAMYTLIEKINEELGVKFLGFNVEGFGGLGLAKLPENIEDPAADKKIMIRVPPMLVFQQPCTDVGFQTVSIPYAELYTALQTGVADGWSGGPAMVNYVEFRDVIKYFVVNNNFFENTSYVMSMKTWNKLSPEEQDVVYKAARIISDKSFEFGMKNDNEFLGKMEEKGIKVVRFSPEVLASWADWARKNTWPKLESRFGKETIDTILADYK